MIKDYAGPTESIISNLFEQAIQHRAEKAAKQEEIEIKEALLEAEAEEMKKEKKIRKSHFSRRKSQALDSTDNNSKDGDRDKDRDRVTDRNRVTDREEKEESSSSESSDDDDVPSAPTSPTHTESETLSAGRKLSSSTMKSDPTGDDDIFTLL